MKVLVLLVLLCVLPQDSKLTTEYDRFKDLTTVANQYEYVRFSKAPNVKFVQFRCTFNYKGRELRTPPDKLGLGFAVFSYEWQFETNTQPSLIILVDDRKIYDGDGERISFGADPGYVYEIVGIKIDRLIVKQMAEAKTVEIQIGTLEVSLTSANQQSLRDIIAKSQP